MDGSENDFVLWGGWTYPARILGSNMSIEEAKNMARKRTDLRYFEITQPSSRFITSARHRWLDIPFIGTLHWMWWN